MKASDLPTTLDLGGGHSLIFFPGGDGEEVIGAFDKHPSAKDTPSHKEGEECAGAIHFDVPGLWPGYSDAKWTVESWDPLTLSPSVLCTLCGNHGFIRAGKWVPA